MSNNDLRDVETDTQIDFVSTLVKDLPLTFKGTPKNT